MFHIERDKERIQIPDKLPFLPLRDIIVFPYMVVPIFVGREASIRAIQKAMAKDQLVYLCAQTNPAVEHPSVKELYTVGVVAKVLQVHTLPNGMLKVLIEGITRARAVRFLNEKGLRVARLDMVKRDVAETPELKAHKKVVLAQFNEYVKLNSQIPDEVLFAINVIEEAEHLADVLSAHIIEKMDKKQGLLEAGSLAEQLHRLSVILASEIEILRIEKRIDNEVRSRMTKTQREYYLQEQLKAIREELGEVDEQSAEMNAIKEQIEKAGMPAEIKTKALAEMDKLRKMHIMSPESAVVRNYLDWLISLPWTQRTRDNLHIEQVQKMLDEDHYGLEKPKERIIEYLAVLRLSKKIKGPILCFVGPPGVGKTSLGRSIARAMGRKFVRISLGGIRDEAEIRGHRRTYVGSMPGRIIQSMKRARTRNPVFLLDEVDKMSMDFRGDPSAALLEVLDPEQNNAFSDHYLDVDFDLSETLFITTANVRFNIPAPLLDRMEIIELPGYLEHEKVGIARDFLVPKQIQENGLKARHIDISEQALVKIIRSYTQESGVRNMERELATICRKVAKQMVTSKKRQATRISAGNVHRYLGPAKFQDKKAESADAVGVATGLAWTEVGGEILSVEVTLMEGRGKLILTGQLGDIMQESAHAALSYTRSQAAAFGISNDFYKKTDVHIHVPEGSIPKDGPSAGITMAVALISALSRKAVRRDVALTGEITLRGRVLPVGGLNEKCLAALRAGMKKVVIPKENDKDYKELPAQLKRGLTFSLVESMEEVVTIAIPGLKMKGKANTSAGRAKRTRN